MILTSALIGLVALIGGLLGIAGRSASYDATAKILIVPRTTDDGLAINGADTLSRGPVASTFAEVYSSSRVVQDALSKAGFDAAEAAQVSVGTSLITDTSVIVVSGTSDSPVLAERAANAVAGASPDLGGYTRAFSPEQIGSADGTAARSGASTSTLVVIAIVVALVLALATAAVLGRVFPPPPSGSPLIVPGNRGVDGDMTEPEDDGRTSIRTRVSRSGGRRSS
jgi:capsular polysaccharide biosynthesis protein